MPGVPPRLEEWTYPALSALAEAGQSESDRHDFKGGLEGTERTTKHCCAFANGTGGFIVYGVSNRGGGQGWDIRGLERDEEFARKFSDQGEG